MQEEIRRITSCKWGTKIKSGRDRQTDGYYGSTTPTTSWRTQSNFFFITNCSSRCHFFTKYCHRLYHFTFSNSTNFRDQYQYPTTCILQHVTDLFSRSYQSITRHLMPQETYNLLKSLINSFLKGNFQTLLSPPTITIYTGVSSYSLHPRNLKTWLGVQGSKRGRFELAKSVIEATGSWMCITVHAIYTHLFSVTCIWKLKHTSLQPLHTGNYACKLHAFGTNIHILSSLWQFQVGFWVQDGPNSCQRTIA